VLVLLQPLQPVLQGAVLLLPALCQLLAPAAHGWTAQPAGEEKSEKMQRSFICFEVQLLQVLHEIAAYNWTAQPAGGACSTTSVTTHNPPAHPQLDDQPHLMRLLWYSCSWQTNSTSPHLQHQHLLLHLCQLHLLLPQRPV
jgi:hypothetical protein